MPRTAELERGRASYELHAWADAYTALLEADQALHLGPGDLERLAVAAYMLARDDEYVACLERAHRRHLDAGEIPGAVRCAFWIGLNLLLRGASGPAAGWFGRGRRLLEREEQDCVERGYLLVPVQLERTAAGDASGLYATATETAEIGARFGDADLVAFGLQDQGHALIMQGRLQDGLRLLDETMVSVMAGELSPVVTGLVYCNLIDLCQQLYEVRRARQWTDAMTRWCEEQPDMVAHTGLCLLHRAEIMELSGAWSDALEEAALAGRRLAAERAASGYAEYRRAEVHRLRGQSDAAEEAYREASRRGYEPQPGLALLRLAQGNGTAAAAGLRRLLDETADPLKRARLLRAQVEVALASGAPARAQEACRELEAISASRGNEVLEAMSAHASGALALAERDHHGALAALRRAWEVWQGLGAPYEAARARLLIAKACRALGDGDAARLEIEAAREAFEALGAAPDLARAESLAGGSDPAESHGLSPRELEVLRLVAAGARNRDIAAQLVLSERTVDRHVSNILAKLRVSSRGAAAAYAYEHGLV